MALKDKQLELFQLTQYAERRLARPPLRVPGFSTIEVVSFMRMMLMTFDEWAVRGLLALYELGQRKAEQKKWLSAGENKLGFSRYDAPLLTRLAKRAARGKLAEQEVLVVRELVPRYARQIAALSDPEKLAGHLRKYYRLEDAHAVTTG